MGRLNDDETGTTEAEWDRMWEEALPVDDRVERMIEDPEAYFAEARERAEAQARSSVERDLEAIRRSR